MKSIHERHIVGMQEQDLQRLAKLRLMDDDFFSEALNGKAEAVQFILNTILECTDLKVKNTAAQVEYKSAVKRSIKLDIQAEDSQGRVIDIEIQRADRGSGVKRARFHSSMLDRSLLAKGADFEDLADTYVIFITENDKFSEGVPLYHIERTVEELEHRCLGDGAHIIYVNGSFRDMTHPVGRLMHDFHCQNAKDMVSPLLADEVRALKETEGGKRHMCRLLEEMREEAAAEATAAAAEAAKRDKAEMAVRMMKDQVPLEKISLYSGLSMDEIRKIKEKHQV